MPPTKTETAEEERKRLKRLKEKQDADALEFAELKKWFADKCDRRRPLWEQTIKDELAADNARQRAEVAEESNDLINDLALLEKELRASAQVRREAIAKRLAEKAERDVARLDADINSQIIRTGMILTATTILFAVFALRTTTSKSAWAVTGTIFLASALFMAAIAFVAALMPLRPPFRRAWKDKFHQRALHTLLMPNYFTSWVMDSWLGDRRSPVVQCYKKAHSVAVPLLIAAAILVVPGLGFSLIFR